MRPLGVSFIVLSLWVASWFVAALWSRRTVARPSFAQNLPNAATTALGAGLFVFGAEFRFGAFSAGVVHPPLWRLLAAVGWSLTGLVVVGLAFTWWARLTLGDLWSGNVTRKENHVLIQAGPYRLVRHPIYTGLILALAAVAIQVAMPSTLLGVVLIAVGFWLKARLEEDFLVAAVGEAAYADFRRTTPMLIPFWPRAG